MFELAFVTPDFSSGGSFRAIIPLKLTLFNLFSLMSSTFISSSFGNRLSDRLRVFRCLLQMSYHMSNFYETQRILFHFSTLGNSWNSSVTPPQVDVSPKALVHPQLQGNVISISGTFCPIIQEEKKILIFCFQVYNNNTESLSELNFVL